MSQMAASMAGDRLLTRAKQPISRLVGLFAGTCLVLGSLWHSWFSALVQLTTLEVNADLATILWLSSEATDHALMVVFLAAIGWLIHDEWLTHDQLHLWQTRACRDPLTGAANRRALHRYLRSRTRERRSPKRLITLMIDLDGFKKINDLHGHHTGDQALRAVATTLKDHFKRCDDVLIVRWGGDEFVVVLPYVSPAYNDEIRSTLSKKLSALSVTKKNTTVFFRASVGYAAGSSDNIIEFTGLIKAADLTLLGVKKQRHQSLRAPTASIIDRPYRPTRNSELMMNKVRYRTYERSVVSDTKSRK